MQAAFVRAQDAYDDLRLRFDAGAIAPDQFKAAVEAQMIDAGGSYWMLGVDSGKWYAHDGKAWRLADPPAEPPSTSATGAPSASPRRPTIEEGPTPARNPTQPPPTSSKRVAVVPHATGSARFSRVTTVAGDGRRGFADGPGDRARFCEPCGISLAADGTLYIADSGNHRLRSITAQRTVATLGRAGRMFDFSRDGALDGAGFYAPVGVALDAQGNLYVAERDKAIRIVRLAEQKVLSISKVDPGTLAGLAVMPDGTLFASETETGPWHRILKVRLGSAPSRIGARRPDSLADWRDGPADQAWFCEPAGLSLDSQGNLYVADSANHRIRKCDPGGRVTTLAGSGSGFADGRDARFNRPRGVAVDDAGCVYVADAGNHRIRRIDPDGSVSTVAGCGRRGYADGPAADALFDSPSGLCVGPDHTIYVADEGNHCIRAIGA